MAGGANPGVGAAVETGFCAGASCPTDGGLKLTVGVIGAPRKGKEFPCVVFIGCSLPREPVQSAWITNITCTDASRHKTRRAVPVARPRSALRMEEALAMPIAAGNSYGTVHAPKCQCSSPFPPILPVKKEDRGHELTRTWDPLKNWPPSWPRFQALSGWTAPSPSQARSPSSPLGQTVSSVEK